VTQSQATLRQFFSALVLDPLPRIVAATAAGRRVTIDDRNGNPVEFRLLELDFVPASSRPAKRVERQLDRAVKAAETSLFNPLEVMRIGAEFMAGTVEETIGALHDAPYDPANKTLDLFDNVAVTIDTIAGQTWTVSQLDVKAKLLRAEIDPPNPDFRIVATDIAFLACLTPDDVVGLLAGRLSTGLSARVSPEGQVFIDLTRSRGHIGALCEISIAANSIVINVRRGVVLGREVPLPRRYHQSHEVPLEGLVPTLAVTDVTWRRGQFEISGQVKDWQRLLTPDHIRSITSQLASGST